MWEGSFVVDLWERIFRELSKISWFYLIKRFYLRGNVTHDFVDKWVLSNTIFALLVAVTMPLIKWPLWIKILLIYGSVRIFEILIYQINVLLFDPYRAYKSGKPYSIKSPIRTVILLLHNLVEIIAWYAAIYSGIIMIHTGSLEHSSLFYLMGSAICMTTFDSSISSELAAGTVASMVKTIAFLEVETGVIMTVISLVRFIGLLPNVTNKK